jgi:metallo-beta-lactamase class B
LLDGLYLVTGPEGLPSPIPNYRGCCVYLIRGQTKHVLIDTGLPVFTEGIVHALDQLGVQPGDIELVALTHKHDDHVGGASLFQRHGARLAIHKSAVVSDADPTVSYWHAAERVHRTVVADVLLSDGDVLRAAGIELCVHHTPGHSPDGVCFSTRIGGQDVIFTGDLGGWFLPNLGSSYEDTVRSVDKTRLIPADLICRGHAIVADDVPGYWEKMSRAVHEGIFQLVDRTGFRHYEQRARQALAGGLKGRDDE